MTHLIELAQLLTKNKFKHLEVFAHNSKLKFFYEKLADGSLKTEQEAQEFFFGQNKNAKLYYYRLANQLEERLLSLLFLIDFHQTATNQIQKEALICYRNYAAVNSLLVRFMRAPAIKLAEETIKISLKNEFSDVTLPLARHLALHYSSIEKNKKKYTYFKNLVDEMRELVMAEILAEKYYSEVIWYHGHNRSADLDLAKKIATYADELKQYTSRLSSLRLNLFAHNVFVFRYEMLADYTKTVEACEEALRFYENQKQETSRSALTIFLNRMMVSLTMLGEYKRGQEAGERSRSMLPTNNLSWFVTSEGLFRLHLHSKSLEQALAIFVEVKNNPALSKQPSIIQEGWRINEALIYYLIRTGKLNKPKDIEIKFKPKKFVNEFNLSNHDKAGNNINLITIQILFLLLDKDFSTIADKVDALSAYTHRHLRRDETYRSNCFIKMLLQLVKGDFHPSAVKRKAEPFYKKLLEVPLSKAKQDYELEIIPYEILWEFVIESLPTSPRQM
jgi:hypothetical protein